MRLLSLVICFTFGCEMMVIAPDIPVPKTEVNIPALPIQQAPSIVVPEKNEAPTGLDDELVELERTTERNLVMFVNSLFKLYDDIIENEKNARIAVDKNQITEQEYQQVIAECYTRYSKLNELIKSVITKLPLQMPTQ